jgi:hypothetical protein
MGFVSARESDGRLGKAFDLCRYTNYLLQGGQGNKDKRDNESNKVTKNIVRLLL